MSTSAALERSLFEQIAVKSCSESSIRFVRGSSSRYCTPGRRRAQDGRETGTREAAGAVVSRGGGRVQSVRRRANRASSEHEHIRPGEGRTPGSWVGGTSTTGENAEAGRASTGPRTPVARAPPREKESGRTWSNALIGARKMMAVAGRCAHDARQRIGLSRTRRLAGCSVKSCEAGPCPCRQAVAAAQGYGAPSPPGSDAHGRAGYPDPMRRRRPAGRPRHGPLTGCPGCAPGEAQARAQNEANALLTVVKEGHPGVPLQRANGPVSFEWRQRERARVL